MTKQEVLTYLDTYTRLGTLRRSSMSKGYADAIRRQVIAFLNSTDSLFVAEGAALAIELRSWLANQDCRSSSKNTMAGNLSRFFAEHFLLERKHVEEIVRRFPRSASSWSSQALDASQLLALFKFYKPSKNAKYADYRNYCLLATALLIGARRSQVIRIAKWEYGRDDTFNLWLPRLKNESQTATLKRIPRSIVLPTGDTYGYALDLYCGVRKAGDYFFNTSSGKKLGDAYLYSMLLQFKEFKVHPHQLRHTAGTLVSERAGITQAAILLDHEHVSTTQGYVTKAHVDTGKILETAWKS